jgi:hypothetical protein
LAVVVLDVVPNLTVIGSIVGLICIDFSFKSSDTVVKILILWPNCDSVKLLFVKLLDRITLVLIYFYLFIYPAANFVGRYKNLTL